MRSRGSCALGVPVQKSLKFNELKPSPMYTYARPHEIGKGKIYIYELEKIKSGKHFIGVREKWQ